MKDIVRLFATVSLIVVVAGRARMRDPAPQASAPQRVCKATGAYAHVPGMDNWCVINCAQGHCPSSHCTCA